VKIKISDYIVKFFASKGLNQCFVVTGGGAMHINDSFGHSSNFSCVYNHHEQACAMAAEGYAQITGRPAIVSVTSGPGTTNALTGVLGAWLDSIPMIIISGQMKRETLISSNQLGLRQLGFQEYNIIESVRSMTKYSTLITEPKLIHYHLERAYNAAVSGRKGPVWLDIPVDIQGILIDENEISIVNIYDGHNEINEYDVQHLHNKLRESSKPVLLVGYQVRMENAHEEFLKLVDFLGIPVVTEWNCHDLLSDSHPLNAGRPGTIGNRSGNIVLQNADLLITLGCQLSIRQISYEWKNFAKNAYIIGINCELEELIKPTLNIDYCISGSIKEFILTTLRLDYSPKASLQNGWNLWTQNMAKKYQVHNIKRENSSNFVSVYDFFNDFSNSLNDDSITVLANGAACVAGLQTMKIGANQRVFTNAGASSMGYAICAAIGAATAVNNLKNIYCIEGDGSIQMNIQELQTIIHSGFNIKLFWINNSGYHSIKQTQKSMFSAESRGYCGADFGSGISFPSAQKIALAYGYPFFQINSKDNMDLILQEINKTTGPILCEVITNPNEDFSPKLISRISEDGLFVTPSLEDMYPFLSDAEMRENLIELDHLLNTTNAE